MQASSPPGWYPDPEVPGAQRYWDGSTWTEHRAARFLPSPGPDAGASHAYATPPATPQWQVASKSPALAALASFFVPGLGSLINGQVGIGIIIFGCYLVSWLLVVVLIGIPMVFGVWVWGMVQAYVGARDWNARHGIIS